MLATPSGLHVAFLGTGELGTFPDAGPPILASLSTAHPVGIGALGEGILAISSPSEGRVVVLGNDMRVVADHRLDGQEPAAGAARRAGEATFVESTRKGASCQSCHIHADSDDVRHDIGHGERRPTLSVRGIAGTAPYLRGASYPSLGTLGSVTETIFGGYTTERPNRRTVLAAYVESLPGFANPRLFDPPPIDVERRGAAAFKKARCDLCHPAPAFTSLGQIRKPILFEVADDEDPAVLDVPSLIGLRVSAPYLSNGRADTIASVLGTHNERNSHGDADSLSEDELRALIAFLEGL
jgi:cytochrome c5